MLDTAVEGSVDNGYTVYPPQIWIHTDTMVRYNDVAGWWRGATSDRRVKVTGGTSWLGEVHSKNTNGVTP